MDYSDKQKLKAQIEQEAGEIVDLEGSKLAESILSICNSLLKTVARTIPGGEKSDDVSAGYLGLAAKIVSYFESLDETQKSGEAEDRLKRALEDLHDKQEHEKELKQQYEEALSERLDLKKRIEAIEGLMAGIPEETIKLRAEHKEKETVLTELQNADELYSPEKEEELNTQISQLRPVVEAKLQKSEELNNKLDSLKKMSTEYDEKTQTLSTNVIEIIKSNLSDLENCLDKQESFLDETEKRADSLAHSVESCKDRLENYRNWYGVAKTPLEQMEEMLSHEEYVNLNNTMDVGEIPRIKERFDNTEENLKILDDPLKRCADATQADLERIRRIAGQ